jgi:sulfur carrier protein ThiS
MQIQVKLVGVFHIGRFKEETRQFPDGSCVQDVIESLELPQQLLGFALINGVHAGYDSLLNEGDKLTILPLLDGG